TEIYTLSLHDALPILFRTCEWNTEEVGQIRAAVQRGIASGYKDLAVKSGDETPSVTKALEVVERVWRSYVRHWRDGSRPAGLEVVATLACSFLPFARYPDTQRASAELALTLAS